MANSERTFADRLQRGIDLQTKILKFDPPFEPANTALDPTNFKLFLDLIETRNTLVATTQSAATAAIDLHASLMATIKSRTTRVVDYISSNEAWSQFLPGVKQAANKVRNYHPSANKKETPAGPAGSPAKPASKTGQQSYGDIDSAFEKLIEAVKLVPGYAPKEETNIQIAQLTELAASYRTANKAVATNNAALDAAQRSRKAGFDDAKAGLRQKMKDIKKATGAQYSRKSPEYASVKGIAV
jgi:hypothetical protein